MKKITGIILFVLILGHIQSQNIKYSTKWFGPNANAVPEFSDGTIPEKTNISIAAQSYFGQGDCTYNPMFKIEIPFVAKKVALKIWSPLYEYYQTTDKIQAERNSTKKEGVENSDVYVQTRISLLSESKTRPAIILNSTLKTAAAKTVKTRRYFDTPSYYFDVEIFKKIKLEGNILDYIQAGIDAGFMCWETTNSMQDDAPMYGLKLITGNKKWNIDNSISGYQGWIHTSKKQNMPDYGDAPVVYRSRINLITSNNNIFIQYEKGLHDFPYNQLQIGISIAIKQLTPRY